MPEREKQYGRSSAIVFALAGIALIAFAVIQELNRFPWLPSGARVFLPGLLGLALVTGSSFLGLQAGLSPTTRRFAISGLSLVVVAGVLVAALILLTDYFGSSAYFAASLKDPPPGVAVPWSPDALVLVMEHEPAEDYEAPGRGLDGWFRFGPAFLKTYEHGDLEIAQDTPIFGSCGFLSGRKANRPQRCFALVALIDDGPTVEWVRIIDRLQDDRDGNTLADTVDTVYTIVAFDRIDAEGNALIGTAGDRYELHPDFAADRFPPDGVEYPTFVTFDRVTGLVIAIEPVSFGG